MMEQKISEENIENNLCFVSNLEKHLQSNQYQDLFFEIRHIRTQFSLSVKLWFRFLYKTMTKQDCVSEQFRKKEWM